MFESEAHTERGSPRPAVRAGSNLVGRGIANPQEYLHAADFENYLRAQNKRNIKQILCYAQRYHSILETGDASSLVNLSSATRRHAMEALTALSKYLGCYDKWQEIRKRYQLRWTSGDESVKSLERFFNPKLTLDMMLQRIRLMIENIPPGQVKSSSLLVSLDSDLRK